MLLPHNTTILRHWRITKEGRNRRGFNLDKGSHTGVIHVYIALMLKIFLSLLSGGRAITSRKIQFFGFEDSEYAIQG